MSVTLQPNEACVAQPPSAVSCIALRRRLHSRGRLCHTDFVGLKCYQ